MLKQENLAANFCGLLSQKSLKDLASEWRILGQEQNGSILASWIFTNNNSEQTSNIGVYDPVDKAFNILHSFSTRENVIQASVNTSRTLLVYVVKSTANSVIPENEDDANAGILEIYKPYILEINDKTTKEPISLLTKERNKQIMVQFLWRKQKTFEKNYQDKFLIMIHDECILLFTASLKKTLTPDLDAHSVASTKIDFKNDLWYLDKEHLTSESIVRNFSWSQWDPTIQALYYIHYKPVTRNSLEKEDKDDDGMSPTLSAFQFHDDLPTETVLNIPLNLPKLPFSNSTAKIVYEDDTVPLRVHDSSLNLTIVSDENGMLFVCHYYLYQPVKLPEENQNDIDTVHFAYSVTILHHGCVIHCVIPGISWEKAKLMKPTFTLHGDHHMLVFQSDIFMHLLDIGLTHEPCCHIVCPPFNKQSVTHLVPCLKWGSLSYDSATLDLISITISKSHLIETFKSDTSLDNRLSIIHYFLAHSNDMEILAELLNIIMEHPLNLDIVPLIKEALISGTYSTVKTRLPTEAASFIRFLPLTTSNTLKPIQAKIANLSVGLSHETLWNTTMMLLSPQQRLSPYRTDIWTRLWDRLNENKERTRFSSHQVTEKLMFSLACYQPEALSRCTTPMTPSGLKSSSTDFFSISYRNQSNDLPFIEFEECTASKQEHVISVNLRELSVHLVKHSAKQNVGFRWLKESYYDHSPAPTHVHAVASQYAAAQYELSRTLCVLVCRAAGIDARVEMSRGFTLIDQMSSSKQYASFYILERYCLAAESLAFPLPQGFSSFFTYLGYRALSYDIFLQYVQRHVFELQIDVMKVIMADIGDSKEGVRQKLNLLSVLPRSRARRLLNKWNYPVSLQIRGREHALNILYGVPIHPRGSSSQNRPQDAGPASGTTSSSYPSKENISPLDNFLELLTAKASLNEIDFNLLIEATISSLELSSQQ